MGILNNMTNEKLLTFKPSQVINIFWFILGVALYKLFFIPTVYALYKFLVVYYHKYDINQKSISEHHGIFNRYHIEVTYDKVKTIEIKQPFFLRMFDLSIIDIIPDDMYTPRIRMYAVTTGEDVKNMLMDLVKLSHMEEKVNLYRNQFDKFY